MAFDRVTERAPVTTKIKECSYHVNRQLDSLINKSEQYLCQSPSSFTSKFVKTASCGLCTKNHPLVHLQAWSYRKMERTCTWIYCLWSHLIGFVPPEGGDLIKSCTGKLCPEAQTLTIFMLLLMKIAPHDFINLEQKIAPLSYTSRIRQNNGLFLRLPHFLMDLPSCWFSCSKLSCVMHCYFCPNLASYHPCFSLLFHFAADFDPFI